MRHVGQTLPLAVATEGKLDRLPGTALRAQQSLCFTRTGGFSGGLSSARIRRTSGTGQRNAQLHPDHPLGTIALTGHGQPQAGIGQAICIQTPGLQAAFAGCTAGHRQFVILFQQARAPGFMLHRVGRQRTGRNNHRLLRQGNGRKILLPLHRQPRLLILHARQFGLPLE